MLSKLLIAFMLGSVLTCAAAAQEPAPTFAERLGWPRGSKVVIFHVDDAGMSHESNRGTIRAIEEGVATSCSIMMPCPWVVEFKRYLATRPQADAGLHLTLTSEWDVYRWGPLAGKPAVPGLVDPDGCLWPTVAEVIEHATPDEVEREIRAQIDRAQAMGIDITHLDSHMGTLFESPLFLQRYVKVGIELKIPVLFPGGHQQYIAEGANIPRALVDQIARTIWDGGLPVIDDVHATSYDWAPADKVGHYVDVLKNMRPGILEIVMHATEVSPTFDQISSSGPTRQGDLDAMLDPRLKETIAAEGIVLTTWRELKVRRDQVK